jgi:hypothetical protein
MSNQNVNISFIPKEPLLRGDSILRKRPIISLSLLIGIVAFTAALIGAGGVYFYKNAKYDELITTQGQLQEINSQLEASDVISSIEEYRTLRDQIDQVGTILDKHIALTSLFAFLEETTLSEVSYGTFSIKILKEGTAQITMVGQAASYAELANQSSVYASRSDVLTSYEMGGFRLSKNGTVVFSFSGEIDVSALYYNPSIDDESENDNDEE